VNHLPPEDCKEKHQSKQPARQLYLEGLHTIYNTIKHQHNRAAGKRAKASSTSKPGDFSSLLQADSITLATARQWLPTEAHITKHQYDGRWRLVFKGVACSLPGKSSSWTSKGEHGEALSLQEVLKEGWRQWCDLSGDACPHKGFM
jgi:hypothetical protein